ncbi:26_t:CDS:1, partial [Scutellospora calospora]
SAKEQEKHYRTKKDVLEQHKRKHQRTTNRIQNPKMRRNIKKYLQGMIKAKKKTR